MASKEAEHQVAKWENGKWYEMEAGGCHVRVMLQNFRADIVDKFNESLAREAIRKAAGLTMEQVGGVMC